ncbi:keratin-associated protein 13-1-like [Trichechus manatus latirostris]|uniref:Keratin-associated protein n=1 Tax=Trichechus manatus latirostris TaxID=127582 RepID=A0A2Y9EC92_TRIMA|nr:keratin-associated protein 13-1-like [Trichechus manatus latirostris]
MSYNCCSGNFSSRSLQGSLCYPGFSCGSSSPSHLVYSTGLCSPRIYPLGSSLYRGCQETCGEPRSYQTSCVVSSPCQTSCYCPRTSMLCSPCQKSYAGSLSFSSRSCHSLGYGSRSCYSLSCGSSGFRPFGYGVRGFPSVGCGFRFCRPTYFPFRSFQSFCYQPIYRSGFYRLIC